MYVFMFTEKANFPITFMAKYFDVSPSAYYDWIKNKDRHIATAHQEAQLVEEIREIHNESAQTYGSPRIDKALRQNGFCVNHKRVERLMHDHEIVAIQPHATKRTTIAAIDPTSATDLVQRDFLPRTCDEKWCGDITYIRTQQGWLYLATVMDMASRRVLGYSMADHMRTSLIHDALKMAVATRSHTTMDGTIFHHDRGSQYMSGEFVNTCQQLGIRSSCSAVGVCFDCEDLCVEISRFVSDSQPSLLRVA